MAYLCVLISLVSSVDLIPIFVGEGELSAK